MRRSVTTIVAALLLGACQHGQRLSTFPAARSPAGVTAELRLRDTTISGELLEVQESALVVVTAEGRFIQVPIGRIRRGRFGGRTMVEAGIRAPVAEIRSLSRYPAGLTPDLRMRLLSAYGQTQIETVR